MVRLHTLPKGLLSIMGRKIGRGLSRVRSPFSTRPRNKTATVIPRKFKDLQGTQIEEEMSEGSPGICTKYDVVWVRKALCYSAHSFPMKIGQCLMGCTRTKYNMLCEGTAGSLLENVAAFPSTSHLASFLGSFLPHQCSFLTARDGAPDSYRIDPELDKEIKRMYADKDVLERHSNEATSNSSGF
ncbi:unnamed protein product [Angiostrongylus costaricensis]|uniref:Uncharacterized protein n=1 Tax=Angiostrongylus costaricensis TaxID=334426 RepID=A0A0R3PDW2_ANGCS|nr:unnamed protein product [Angiostrongylus costaricensis]